MKHAGSTWWTPLRVLLILTAFTFALGMVQKTGCHVTGWTDSDVRYSQMCYSDMPYLYSGRGFAELAWPYSGDLSIRERYEQVMEYPAGIAYWAWGTAWLTQAAVGFPDLTERLSVDVGQLWGLSDVHREVILYVVINALGLALIALATTWLLALARQRNGATHPDATHPDVAAGRRDPTWDVLAFAASPILLFTGLVNWDLLAVVCVAAAILAWVRNAPVWLGIAIGIGTAVKLYPLFLLGAVLVLCLRRRQMRDFYIATGVAVVAWFVANLPAMVTGFEQWKVFWSFNSDRGPDLGSLWLVAQQVSGTAISASTVNLWSWLLFAAWCGVVLVLGLAARRTPTFAELGFLILAGFLIINKVYSPQYVLWLLPLAVLARPRFRDQVWWQAGEFFYFASVWWYLGGYLAPAAGDDQPFYWLAIVVRVGVEIWLAALIIRSWRVSFARQDHSPVAPAAPTPVDQGQGVKVEP